MTEESAARERREKEEGMQSAADEIKARAGLGAYAGICPRCGAAALPGERVSRVQSMQIPEVEICRECNVDELIGADGGVLALDRWAIIRRPEH